MTRSSGPFRIAHVSDLHLTASDAAERSEPKLLGRLRGMNDAFRKVVRSPAVQEADVLLVTGDVTDRGDLASWRVFWRIVDDAGLRARTWVIPGNHDVACLGVRLPSRGSYGTSDLARARSGLRLKPGHPIDFPWAKRLDERVVVFGVNSNNLGNLTGATNAMGQIGVRQLAKLARLLRAHQDVPVKIVALHHSPNIPADEVAKRRGVAPLGWLGTKGHQIGREAREALRLVAIAQGVRLIVHGHLHRREDRRVDGIRIVGVPASTEPRVVKGKATYELALYTVDRESHRVAVTWPVVPS